MAGPSIAHWSWLSRPDIKLENGVFVDGNLDLVKPYSPGEHTNLLLSNLQKVVDEKSALNFVHGWGLLGLNFQADISEKRSNMFFGAVDFTYAQRKKEQPETDYSLVSAEVADYFGFKRSETGRYVDLSQPRETPEQMIRFADHIRHVSEIKRMLQFFKEDPDAADYDAEEWVKCLSPNQYEEFVGPPLKFWREQYKKGYSQPYFYQYLLETILKRERSNFSHYSRRGVWIQLYTSPISGQPDGWPVLQFDGLFRFIEYVLLAEQASTPLRCTDPKCRHLFFPNRAGQKYCPPPPGKKRSLCEQRHSKETQPERKEKKDGQTAKGQA